ncbi:hypothetical protein ACFQ9X_07740 [Catenulispora yoronensis]
MSPLVYQFTNQASDGGHLLDYNAYRGSVADLDSALSTSPTQSPIPTPTEDDDMPAFATGEIKPGADITTMVCPPPSNSGAAGWGAVWFSLGCDFGDGVVRCAAYIPGSGWDVKDNVRVPKDSPA